MLSRWRRGGSRLAFVLSLSAVCASRAAASDADRGFGRLADEYLSRLLDRNPQIASRLGLVGRDRFLVPVSQATLAEDATWLHGFRERLAGVDRSRLSFERALDRDVLAARVDRDLLDAEAIRPFENDPNAYLDLAAGSLEILIERERASPCGRIRAAVGRLEQVPEVLRAARVTLRDPPRLAVEAAIVRFERVVQLYRQELPAAVVGCKESRMHADLAEAAATAVRATEAFLAFLREDLLPRSNGVWALGRERTQALLASEAMETAPVESLLARGMRSIDITRQRMEAVAGRNAPGRGVQAALDLLSRDAPDAATIEASVEAALGSARRFTLARGLVSLPADARVMVREMPAYRCDLALASLVAPGPWTIDSRAYLQVAPADPAWPDSERQEHSRSFNRYEATLVALGEAYPGRYAQALAARRAPSRLRQALATNAALEGWVGYCESMAIEEGYGRGDPRLELAALARDLARQGRFVVGILLHTQGMTLEEAQPFLVARCFRTPVEAAREARRAALDPGQIVGLIGAWRIEELRAELRLRLGPRFVLRVFHDELLGQGPSPMPVVRKALLRKFRVEDRGDTTIN